MPMPSNIKISLHILAVLEVIIVGVSFVSCKKDNVPYDTKYIAEFHQLSHSIETVDISNDKLALYVDYSNCIANGMSSPFYQKMVSPLTAATKEYRSIKGDTINRETGNIYQLLNNVEEVNYAALDKAIEQMANREGESVMQTDGELFTQTTTKNNPNNPYMHEAFKKWLLKGHDIHIIAEPFQESYHGKYYNKKRFYIIFTDDRVQGNIYDRIKEIVNMAQFPQVDEFHLSGNYPWVVPTNGNASTPNEIVGANITSFGAFEIQDWQVNWKNIIKLIVNAYDDNGNPLPNGGKLISGLRINKNAFGCYRISDIDVTVTNINDEYFNLYNTIESQEKPGRIENAGPAIENFLIVDKDEFKKHGMVDIYFDINNFAPNGDLTGKPYNYFRIDIVVKSLDNILDNSIDIFNFDSITNDGQTNISIAESLKNCVFDPDLINQLKGKVLYSIYVKSDKY